MFSQWSEKQQQACKILGYKKWLSKNYKVSKQRQKKIIKSQPAQLGLQNPSAQNIPNSAKNPIIIEQTHQPRIHSVTNAKTQDYLHAIAIKGGEIFACHKFTLLYNSSNTALWVLPPLFLSNNQWQIFLSKNVAFLWLDLLEFTSNRDDYNFFQTVCSCDAVIEPVMCSDDNIKQMIDSWDISRVNVLAGEFFLQQIQPFFSNSIPLTLFTSPCLLSCNNQLKYQLWFELEKYSTLHLIK